MKGESAKVRRSREKLLKLWKRQADEATPQRLEEVKELIKTQMARTQRERLPVPDKEGLSLYTNGKLTVKLSPKVQALKEKVAKEFVSRLPVA